MKDGLSTQDMIAELSRRDAVIRELREALEDITENCTFSLKDAVFYNQNNKRNVNEFRAKAKLCLAKAEEWK